MFRKLVTDEGIENLKKHKYKAGVTSKLDDFISSKVSILINYFPKNLAPNMITLIGALIHISSSILFTLYSPSFTPSRPSYTYFYAAITLFIYQIMDIADGKQARRLNLSSPLGQLFDHGLDCITSTFILFNMLMTMRVGDSAFFVGSGVVIVICIFYFANWAEYHTGELVTCTNGFGIIEVQYILIAMYLATGFFGTEIWSNTIYGISGKELTLYTCLILCLTQNIPIIIKAYKDAKCKIRFIKTLIPVFSLLLCVIIIFSFGNVKNCLTTLFFVCNFFYNINCCKLIVISMSGMKFSAFHREMFILYVFTGMMIMFNGSNGLCCTLVRFMFFVGFGLLMNFGFRACKQISRALEIKVLTV